VEAVKTKLLSYLAAAAAFLTALGALDLTGVLPLLPDNVAGGLTIALPLFATIVHLIKALGDAADDGKINGSFQCAPLMFVLALVVSLAATSCTSTIPWSVRTPYGDAQSDADGVITVTPRTVVIPAK